MFKNKKIENIISFIKYTFSKDYYKDGNKAIESNYRQKKTKELNQILNKEKSNLFFKKNINTLLLGIGGTIVFGAFSKNITYYFGELIVKMFGTSSNYIYISKNYTDEIYFIFQSIMFLIIIVLILLLVIFYLSMRKNYYNILVLENIIDSRK